MKISFLVHEQEAIVQVVLNQMESALVVLNDHIQHGLRQFVPP